MTTRNGTYSMRSTKGTCDTASSMRKTTKFIKPAVKQKLSKEQESIMEKHSDINDPRDNVLNSAGKYVVPVEEDNSTDLRRRNSPSTPSGITETNSQAADVTTKSKHNQQEAELWIKIKATQAQLKAAEERTKEEAELLEKSKKEAWNHVVNLYTALTGISNENEDIQNLIKENQMMIGKPALLLCQQCKFLKRREDFKQDKQTEQVDKKISAQADKMKKLTVELDRKFTKVTYLKSQIEEMQQKKISLQEKRAYRDGSIVRLEFAFERDKVHSPSHQHMNGDVKFC
ncbi:uncharacterized protein LOC110840124 isoform X1 [Zootermopsis nevadensis]|uniref:Uncharacterized protein n=1 Tax=Zootermopsis nevadensis TaxID=136037 RepID=A0A067QH03_ZOONE|nr:uncharacterized protein LOC110840124 isoform X1 [Zootermopsis nevadensis]KDR07518.1 hypothetical protein L798_02987 [Zootermopsis nevadensis]